MNTPAKIQHPEWMDEGDIANYDNLISMGRNQLGKELASNEEYLLHLSAVITIKQEKGMLTNLDDASIAELKRIHLERFNSGLIFETPPDEYYESARVLKEAYLSDGVQKELDDANNMTSNLILNDKKITSNIADEGNDVIDDMLVVEDGIAKIKENWVKLSVAEPLQPSENI